MIGCAFFDQTKYNSKPASTIRAKADTGMIFSIIFPLIVFALLGDMQFDV